MRPRLELKVKTTVSNRTTIRNRIIVAGSTFAAASLVAAVIFLFANLGDNRDSRAAIGNNMGFENGTTNWTTISGTWSSNATASFVRSGSKSIKVSQPNGNGLQIKNTSCTVTAPATGNYKMAVTAYAKSSDDQGKLALGVINTVTGVKTMSGGYTDLNSTGFTKVEAFISVSNGETYSPVIETKRNTGGTSTIYVDDVYMYITDLVAADITPPTVPTTLDISGSSSNVTMTWSNGTDSESGVEGVLILRQSGVQPGFPTVTNQTAYHTSATSGPATIGSWTVVHNGSLSTTFTDSPSNTDAYTYLLYTRDKAGNYSSSPKRIVALKGNNAASTTAGDVSVDALSILSNGNLTVASGNTFTINSGTTANIYGTLTQVGVVVNNGSLNMKNGSTYKYDRNGAVGAPVATATWENGSTCYISGVTTAAPDGLAQSFHHFTWNAPNQSAAVSLPNGLVINGNATFTRSGGVLQQYIVSFNGTNSIGGNLSCGVFAKIDFASGNAITFNGTSQQTVESNSIDLRFYSITVANPAGIMLNSDVEVSNSCTLSQGRVTTGSNELSVLSTSTNALVYNNSSYVVGTLRRAINGSSTAAYTFPIGTSSNREFFSLTPNNMVGVSNIAATFNTSILGSLPNAAACIVNGLGISNMLNCGYWTIEPNQQPSGGSYNITLQAKGSTNPTAHPSSLAVIKRPNGLGQWAALGTNVPSAQFTSGGVAHATCYGLTSFSDFGVGYSGYVLPITLSAFDVKTESDDRAIINWTTSAEMNNAYFTLERSSNGVDFEIINEQEGAGNSTTLLNYAFTDLQPLNGTSYYRLKQTDFNGTFSYSPIKAISLNNAASHHIQASDLNIYPNPSTGTFNISIRGLEKPESIAVKIFDAKGQLVFEQTAEQMQAIHVDISTHPTGLYMAQVQIGTTTLTKQLIVQR